RSAGALRSRGSLAALAGSVSSLRLYFFSDPLEVPRLVDDAFEEPLDDLIVERPVVERLHVLQHFLLALRLVDRNAHLALQPADLERACRARVQQPHQRLVEQVDPLPQVVDVGSHASPFSQRTYAPALAATSGAVPCSAITFTSALPTTAASAQRQTSAT